MEDLESSSGFGFTSLCHTPENLPTSPRLKAMSSHTMVPRRVGFSLLNIHIPIAGARMLCRARWRRLANFSSKSTGQAALFKMLCPTPSTDGLQAQVHNSRLILDSGYAPEHGSVVAVQGIMGSLPSIYYLGGKLGRVNNLLQQVISAPSHGPVDKCDAVVCTNRTDKNTRLLPQR